MIVIVIKKIWMVSSMPDISMCINKECKDKDTCYRFNAIPDSYQCYIWKTGELNKETCDSYWPMKTNGGLKKPKNDKKIEIIKR